MQRTNPFTSLASLSLTLILFVGLGSSLLFHGGEAFSPGPLSAQARGAPLAGFSSHAEFEYECKRCHQPLKTNQDALCLDCHTAEAAQLAAGQGVHRSIAGMGNCRACHPDHRGRQFSPALAASAYFDHEQAGFSLVKHSLGYDLAPLSCGSCHQAEQPGLPLDPTACANCHTAHDAAFMTAHQAEFGPACQECHDGGDSLADFDHAQAGFPLDGQHAQGGCLDCHELENLHTVDLPVQGARTCLSCHAEPEVHAGLLGTACGDCHRSQGWLPAFWDRRADAVAFDHLAQTGFSLQYHSQDEKGLLLACRDCHPQALALGTSLAFELSTCLDCHTRRDSIFMQDHVATFGGTCLDCHDGTGALIGFEHAAVFPLDGRHAELACQDCHQAQPGQPLSSAYTSLTGACVTCHAEPAIHAGTFGLECQRCHTAQAWRPALLAEHTFPLDHGEQGVVACETCHLTTYTEYTCYGCHEHSESKIQAKHLEEGISLFDLPNCAQCHPTGQEEEGEGD